MTDKTTTTETFIDPCPKCGDRLLGVSKAEFIAHLRQNDETLAARIWDEMGIEESPPTDDGLRRRNWPSTGNVSLMRTANDTVR